MRLTREVKKTPGSGSHRSQEPVVTRPEASASKRMSKGWSGEGVAAAARRECVSEEEAGAVENRSIQASSWAIARGAPPQAKARIHLAAKEMGENGG